MKRKNRTCVAGIEHYGEVYIGADSAVVYEDDGSIEIRTSPKVFIKEQSETKARMVFGISGTCRTAALLKNALVLPKHDTQTKTDEHYLVVDFVDALRQCYKDHGRAKKSGESDEHDINFLLGYNGRLYTVYDDFDISHTTFGYAACGCGEQYAMSALWMMKNFNHMHPRDKIMTAIAAAAAHNSWVVEPFFVMNI